MQATIGLALIIGAIWVLLLSRDWRWSAVSLGTHYTGVGLVLSRGFAIEIVLAEVILGLAAGTVLWLAASERRRLAAERPARPADGSATIIDDVPLNPFFQFLTLLLCAVAGIGLANTYPIAANGATSSLNFVFFWLAAVGVVALGTTRNALKNGWGILFLFEAVQIAYLARAGAVQSTVLFAQVAVQLLLVLVITRFAITEAASGSPAHAARPEIDSAKPSAVGDSLRQDERQTTCADRTKESALVALAIVVLLAASILAADAFLSAIALTAVALLAALGFQETRDERARLPGSMRFVALATVGGACLQIAVILAAEFQIAREPIVLRVVVGFLAIGLASLGGAFPFHWWLLDLPRRAGPWLAGVLVACVSAGGLVFLLQVLADYPWLLSDQRSQTALMGLGIVAFAFAALVAFSQRDFMRLLAWTIAGNAGVALAGIAVNSYDGLVGVAILLLNQALSVLLLLLCSNLANLGAQPIGTYDVADLASLTRRAPVAAVGVALGSLALLGIPPFAGFLGRWLVFGEVSRLSTYLAVIIVSASLLSFFSFVPVFKALLRGLGAVESAPRLGAAEVRPTPRREGFLLRSFLILLTLLSLGIGLYPVPILDAIDEVLKGLILA